MKFFASIFLCFVVSCAHTTPLTPIPPAPNSVVLESNLDAIEHAIDTCQVDGIYMTCERNVFLDAIEAAGELYRVAGLNATNLALYKSEAEETIATEKSKRQVAEDKISRYQWQRWTWGLAGIVLGGVIATSAILWR